MARTLRINVMDPGPLDGATPLVYPIVAPATEVYRADIGLTEITLPVGTALGIIDLGAIYGDQSSFTIRHLFVGSEVGATFLHAAGSFVGLQGPALPDGTFDGQDRILVDLVDLNYIQGVIAEGINEPIPLGHRLVFDTQADGPAAGPNVIQITLDAPRLAAESLSVTPGGGPPG